MIDRIKELNKILNKARYAYYQKDSEIMSDFEYDKFYDELEKLEKETNIILSNSPTQKVGSVILSQLEKIKHNEKMLSLDKTKSIDKIEEFLQNKKAILSYKMDGLTIVLKYQDGILQNAITRGSGDSGENITHNFKVFENIPLTIPYKDEIIIRGEALISFENFNKINENLEAEEKYKNPRNLCSGTVRQLNNQIAKERKVEFLAFSLVKAEKNFKLKSEQIEFIKSMGFNIVKYKIVNKDNVRETIKIFEEGIPFNQFATDGLVITFNDIEYSKNLGQTSKFPKDSLAYKWVDELVKTTLLEVEWNTSRTGLINPVAIFEQVELEGTSVNRASLHNVSIIKNLKLGIGDTISVYKANMIIPQIGENYTKSDTLEIPSICNACGGKTEIISIRDGVALKCTNEKCIAKLINGIVHYVGRNATNIEDFSKATIEKFLENKFLKDYTDIYFLEKYENEIINMQGFGEKSYKNLIKSIEKSKDINLANFIYALGIEQIGLSNAKLLVKRFNNDILEIRNARVEDLIEIEGFGEIIAKFITNYFSKEENIKNIDKIFPLLRITKEENEQNNILEEKTFVITGNVSKFENRKALQEQIEKFGGKVSSSVSTKTNYLINNDKGSSSSKNKKAKELNIDIINEDDFIQIISNIKENISKTE